MPAGHTQRDASNFSTTAEQFFSVSRPVNLTFKSIWSYLQELRSFLFGRWGGGRRHVVGENSFCWYNKAKSVNANWASKEASQGG